MEDRCHDVFPFFCFWSWKRKPVSVSYFGKALCFRNGNWFPFPILNKRKRKPVSVSYFGNANRFPWCADHRCHDVFPFFCFRSWKRKPVSVSYFGKALCFWSWKRKPVSISYFGTILETETSFRFLFWKSGNGNQFPFPILETQTGFHDVLATPNSIDLL